MAESLVEFFLGIFGGLTSLKYGKELIVFIISLMPILELRGGLIAAALLGLDVVPAFIICLIGNILPLPFILLFITKIFEWMRRWPKLKKLVDKIKTNKPKENKKVRKLNFGDYYSLLEYLFQVQVVGLEH